MLTLFTMLACALAILISCFFIHPALGVIVLALSVISFIGGMK